ncbi:hypothetical protein FXV83_17275 [Bradyrhizobium hipponense]|uniref:Uncharacterized protein n=1 Tax=Bradyrhizobium hipponense TaxID=2605638 RepID=A0A5S4YNR7_9BRAD|nr:hypothetical protein [Bradyrhizobium hipponense]TYO65304.1 hypothetical protein FXV83_17275 [Bradyrhizobium hipponense]
MVDEVTVRRAADTAWSAFRATHPDVDASDNRRCLLERHLQRRGEERESDSEELASLGLAYLHRLPADEC